MNNSIFDRLINWIDRNHRITLRWFVIILLLIFFGFPILLTQVRWFIQFDENTGVIGDTIGGIVGPLIALLAAVLTFFAFWIQYRANRQQQLDLAKERFENKFFEMLRLHKENVNEMVIEGYDTSYTKKTTKNLPDPANGITETTVERIPKLTSGRKIFVTTNSELQACHEICKLTLAFEHFEGKEAYLIKLAYRFLFNGLDTNAVTSVDGSNSKDKEYIKLCRERLMAARRRHESSSGMNKVYHFPGSNHRVSMNFKYKPFSGHSSRFGHYYRHLFLMVNYVVGQEETLFDYSEKRDYLRMVRAQLSKHEQLMLYFNFLSGYGSKWENQTNKFFSDYRMIHNLPIELTSFTISPHDIFVKQIEQIVLNGEQMFEYDE